MSLQKYINKAKKEVLDILESIEDKEKDIDILESYENLNQNVLNILKEKDSYHIKTFFDFAEEKLDSHIKEHKKITIDDIEDIFKKTFRLTENRRFLQYIINLICEDEDEFNNDNIKDNNIDDSESDNDIDEEDNNNNEALNIPINEVIENFKWRDNQKLAIQNTIKQKFKSGVHDQIMGAGKSYIILNLIWNHYQLNKNNLIYPIICYRQEILKDLFFDKDNNIDEKKKKFWKDNDIIDLDKFNIIDRVNKKSKDIKISSKKPNILVINTTFLSSIEKENKLNYKNINFVILDECHGISAPDLYKILKKIKYDYNKSIIGFSATVLRDKAESKVIDIFSRTNDKDSNDDKKLNIISRYDFMDAIRDNVILPPYYTIMEVKKTIKHKIGRQNKDTIESVMKNLLSKDSVPYKKIICWSRTINQMKDYYKFFKERFGKDYKIYCSSSYDDKVSIERFDINGKKYKYNTDYKDFFESEGKSIMICVNRFREGSDIKNLDVGVYLDRVKKRTTLVAMQTSGRVLRVDKEKKKTHGFIIDTFINDDKEKVEMLTANLILSYYNKILQLSEETIENKNNIDNYKKLIETIEEKTKYNEKTRELIVRLDDQSKKDMKIKLELTTKTIDWKYLKNILVQNVDKLYDINNDEHLIIEYNILQNKIKEYKFRRNRDFIKEYKIYAEKNNLETEPEVKYKNYGWNGWYEFLNIDTSIYPKTKEKLIDFCKKNNIITEKEYLKNTKLFDIPFYPQEIYIDWTTYSIELGKISNIRRC